MNYRSSKRLVSAAVVLAAGGLGFAFLRTRSAKSPDSAEAASLRQAATPVSVAASTPNRSSVAATVNGEIISLAKLKTRALEIAGSGALQQLVNDAVIDQALKARGITVHEADIKSKEAEMQRLSGKPLETSLAQNGMTKAEFESNLLSQVKLEKLASGNLKPALNRRHVWHLTITTFDIDPKTGRAKTRTDRKALQIVQQIRQKLDGGANFSDLAAHYSDYVATRQSRGDLGILYDGLAYSSNLFAVARSLKKGEFTRQTIKSPAGYELLYVSSTAENHPESENALYDRAAENYRQQQLADGGMAVMNSLRQKAEVAIDDIRFHSEDAHISEISASTAEVVATVNGQGITTEQVAARTLKVAGAQALQQLVQSTVIAQAAKSRNITVSSDDIEEKKTRLSGGLHGQSLQQALTKKGLTMRELESEIKEEIELEKIGNVSIKAPSRMRHVFHIAIASQNVGPSSLPGAPAKPTDAQALQTLRSLRKEITRGTDFKSLARKYSDDTFTKANGGDMGIVYDGIDNNRDLAKVALGLKKGDLSTPFKSFFGYDMVYVASTAENYAASEDKIYRDAADTYRDAQRSSSAQQTLQHLESKAKVDVVFHP